MAAVTFVPFVVFFSFAWIFVLANEDTQEVTAQPGEDVTLQCRVFQGQVTNMLQWRRHGPGSGNNVFICKDKHPYEAYQHPSYRGRVELRDPEMKDGDFSVILKSVTVTDTGTYECHDLSRYLCILYGLNPMSTINLTVTDSGLTAGHKEGGIKEGGNKEGGNMETGNMEGGDKEGGIKEGGIKERGNQEGGNQEAGIKKGGNTEGRHTDEGREEGRKAEGRGGGHVGLAVGLSLAVLVAVVVVAVAVFRFVVCRKYKVLTDNNSF